MYGLPPLGLHIRSKDRGGLKDDEMDDGWMDDEGMMIG